MFEVLTVVLLKIQIIWDVTLCSCVSSNRNFEDRSAVIFSV